MLPVELLREITQYLSSGSYLETGQRPQQVAGINSKPSWEAFDGFTRACRQFRHLGLETWFRTVFLTREEDIQDLGIYFPQAKENWCRQIHCVQPESKGLIGFTVWDLSGFQKLRAIRIDWMTQKTYPYFFDTHSGSAPIPFTNITCRIEELHIIGRHLSPAALAGFVEPFTRLVRLRLDLQGAWCGLCNTSNAVKLPYTHDCHIVYNNGLGLSIHYGRILCRLSALEEVHISVNNRGALMPNPGISEEKDDTMWSGECSDCMELLYCDKTFLRQWVERKNGTIPAGTKCTAYIRPPQLRTVHWYLWQAGEADDDDSSTWSSSEEDDELLSILSSPTS